MSPRPEPAGRCHHGAAAPQPLLAGCRSGPGAHSLPQSPFPPFLNSPVEAMASRVALSDSDESAPSVNSALPRRPAAQTLRSLVVAPPSGRVLGQEGWAAGAGSSRRPAPAAAPAPTAGPGRPAAGAAGGGWIQANNRHRHQQQAPPEPALAPRQQQRPCGRGLPQHQLPSRAPAGGAASRIPVALHGCCYNCGDEDHIAADCTKPTKCVRCGGDNHISRECQRPRTPSDAAPPEHQDAIWPACRRRCLRPCVRCDRVPPRPGRCRPVMARCRVGAEHRRVHGVHCPLRPWWLRCGPDH
jgi:hypothetical protein